MDEITSLKEPI